MSLPGALSFTVVKSLVVEYLYISAPVRCNSVQSSDACTSLVLQAHCRGFYSIVLEKGDTCMQALLTKAAVVGFILAFAAVPLASSANAAAAETTEREMAPRHREALLKNLTAQWWQWVLSIPVFENPLLDQTGEKCVVGQRGPVWFLAGNFGGGETTRSCSVPEGNLLGERGAGFRQTGIRSDTHPIRCL